MTGKHQADEPSAAADSTPRWALRLRNAAELDAAREDSAAMRALLRWIHDYLVRPNLVLGRSGAVCPFVAPVLQLRRLWIAVVDCSFSCVEDLCAFLGTCLDVYDSPAMAEPDPHQLKTLLAACPNLATGDVASLVERAHRFMKPAVVDRGLMLGEFFPGNPAPGVHNPQFPAGQSPMPLFVLRHIVPGDYVFLNRASDPPDRRAHYLRCYLRAMGSTLSAERATDARRALAASEADALAGGKADG